MVRRVWSNCFTVRPNGQFQPFVGRDGDCIAAMIKYRSDANFAKSNLTDCTSRLSSIKPYIAMFKPLFEEVIRKENSDLNKKSLWLSASQIRGRGRNCWQGKCSGWEKFAKIKIALKGISKMALTELERQKDSISWEPISERADFITTLSYKRGSTIPWCRTLQKSFIKQDQTLSTHCPMTIQLFNTVSYQNTLFKRIL